MNRNLMSIIEQFCEHSTSILYSVQQFVAFQTCLSLMRIVVHLHGKSIEMNHNSHQTISGLKGHKLRNEYINLKLISIIAQFCEHSCGHSNSIIARPAPLSWLQGPTTARLQDGHCVGESDEVTRTVGAPAVPMGTPTPECC